MTDLSVFGLLFTFCIPQKKSCYDQNKTKHIKIPDGFIYRTKFSVFFQQLLLRYALNTVYETKTMEIPSELYILYVEGLSYHLHETY